MILKFKRGSNSNAWYYEQLNNAIIGKVDFSSVVTKYINKDTGKLEVNKENYLNILEDIRQVVQNEIGYPYIINGYIDNIITEIHRILKSTNSVVIKSGNCNKVDMKLIATEAYLMSDDGKTIERLI